MGLDVSDSEIIFTDPDGNKYIARFPRGERYSGPRGWLNLWGVDTKNLTIFCGGYRLDFGLGAWSCSRNPVLYPKVEVPLQKIIDCYYEGCLEFKRNDDLLKICDNKRFAFYSSTIVDIHAFKYFSYCLKNKKVLIVKSFLPAIECPEHIGEADYGDPAASLRPISHLPELIMDNIRSFLVPDTNHPDYTWEMMHDSISDPYAWYHYKDGKYNHICCPKFLAVDIGIHRAHYLDPDDNGDYKYWESTRYWLYPNDMLEENVFVDVMGYVLCD